MAGGRWRLYCGQGDGFFFCKVVIARVPPSRVLSQRPHGATVRIVQLAPVIVGVVECTGVRGLGTRALLKEPDLSAPDSHWLSAFG